MWTLTTEVGKTNHVIVITNDEPFAFERSKLVLEEVDYAEFQLTFSPGTGAPTSVKVDTGLPKDKDYHIYFEVLLNGSPVHKEKLYAQGSGT